MFYERVLGLWVFSFDESTEISTRFLRNVPCKDFFTKNTFCKDVHADFDEHFYVNFVVSVIYPNSYKMIHTVGVKNGCGEVNIQNVRGRK